MKPSSSKNSNLSGQPQQRSRRLVLLPMVTVLASLCRLQAADITWTEGSAPSLPTQWLTAGNWDAGVVPTNMDNAIFGSAGTNANATIQMATAGGLQTVGSITLGSDDILSRTIYNNSGGSAGILVLYGINGVLLQNSSSAATLFLDKSSVAEPMGLGLAASGQIAVDNANAEISCYSVISDYNGSHGFIKTGDGILYLHAANTYTGPTTNAAGSIEVDATGTFGNGSAPLYLTGGNVICGADRSGGVPLANPVVLSANTFILNNAGTTGTKRTLPFSGDWSGTGGTLTVANLTAVLNNTFLLRLVGGFTFEQDVVIGSVADTAGSYAVLHLYNSATNGMQIFNGTVSSSSPTPGSVLRSGATTSPGGTSIFTGDNTYSGGTIISYGALLADNTTGSALGYGQVTVTNQGVLGGNGSVLATTHVGVESPGGVIAPGSLATNIGNLNISDLTFGSGSTCVWQIQAANPNPGVDQDLITCDSQWTDAGNSLNPITIKIDSMGLPPAGWDNSQSYDWTIIQSGVANGFNAGDFQIDASGFAGTVNGGFGLYVSSGTLHLTYTPGSDVVINVPGGSQTQSEAGYPVLDGDINVVKVGNGELVLDNSLNTYSGLTTIRAGTVSLAVDALNGSGSLGVNASTTLLGNTTGGSNATLNIDVDGVTDTHSVTVQEGSSGSKTIGTTLTSGTVNYAGNVTLNDNVVLSAAPGGDANFTGDFSGSGGLTLTGGGAVTLSGSGKYSGITTAGNVTVNLNGKAFGTNTFSINSVVVLDNTSGSSVTLNACPQNWNDSFSFAGTTNLNLGAGSVTMNTNCVVTVSNSVLTIGGSIGGTNFGLTKAGSGQLSLTSTGSTYTGGTTNLAGVIALSGTATFGDGTGPLVFSGGNLLNTGTRSGLPIANPVVINTDATIYGNSTTTASSYRILPFTGTFTVNGGSLKIGNVGSATTIFDVRLQGSNYTTIDWPIVVGDTNFDAPGALSLLDLWNDNTTPAQTISGLISGPGGIRRGATTLNTGGTTILTGQNTFSGGAELDSGAIGLGTSSISSDGAVISGPLGTGTFTLGAENGEAFITVFASGGARVIDNPVFFDGDTNVIFGGTNDLLFTGTINSGGVTKTLTVQNTGLTTFSGAISGNSNGGALVKAGSGALVFSGDNLYPGTTTINEGTLFINNIVGSGTSTNTVAVNTTGTLGGTGTIAGPVVVAGGGSIAPGDNVGTLTLQNGLDLTGGVLAWNLGANSDGNPGVDFSQLSITGGTLALGGLSQLKLQFTGSATAPAAADSFWQNPHTWRIVNLSGDAAISGGNFSAVSNGSYSAGTFATTTDANGVLLTFTPATVPASLPGIAAVSLSGTQLSLTVTNGGAGGTFYVLTATNLTQPVSSWSAVATNDFAGDGTFTNSLTISPADAQRFYLIKLP